jgi:hypothetical protein
MGPRIATVKHPSILYATRDRFPAWNPYVLFLGTLRDFRATRKGPYPSWSCEQLAQHGAAEQFNDHIGAAG